MANEFVARKGLISLSTSSFYGPVNFSGSSLVGIGTGSVLFTNSSGSVAGSSNLVWDSVNNGLVIGNNVLSSAFKLGVNGSVVISGTSPYITFNSATNSATTPAYIQYVNSTSILNILSSGAIDFYSNANARIRLFGGGNFVIGGGASPTDGGQRLQVIGSMRVGTTAASAMYWDDTNNRLGIGTSSPAYNLHIKRDFNGATTFRLSNTSAGNTSQVYFSLESDASSGAVSFGKYSSTTNSYKIINSSAFYFYNSGAGDISILNDFSSGNINFAAGGSTTAHMTIKSNGNILVNTFTDAGYRLDVNGSGAASGSLRVMSGSAFFDGVVKINSSDSIISGTTSLLVAGRLSGSSIDTATFIANQNGGSPLTVKSYINQSILSFDSNGGGIFASYITTRGATAVPGIGFSVRSSGASFPAVNIYANTSQTANLLEFKNDLGNVLSSFTSNGSLLLNTSFSPGYTLHISGSTSGSILVSGSQIQPAVLGNSLTSVNIVPTMVFTTGSQTQTAFKVMPTFSGSSTFTSSQTNIIADFGATSVGSQLIVTDVTSGSIYMVNDVSGIPIIEANSNWDVLMYDYPYTVFKKTGSVVELGALGQASSSVLIKSDLVINEGLGFSYRQSQVSASVAGAVTSSLYNLTFTNVSSSVYIQAVVTGYDTGSRDTISGDIKATIRYRAGAATIVGIDQSFVNTDNSVVGFDIVAGGTSGSLVAFGTGSRTYQFGATVTTQII